VAAARTTERKENFIVQAEYCTKIRHFAYNNRFPAGMTKRKARATAKENAEAGPLLRSG
jgi:hypothetical protein